MKKQRRDIQIFSLSFLDCICCGFGAVILLFVLSKFAEPLIIEEVKDDLEAKIIRLEEELVEIRGETVIINRELTAQKEQLSKEKIRLARLQGDLSKIEGRFAASKDTAQVQNTAFRWTASILSLLSIHRAACSATPGVWYRKN
jgi:hypothetical protein